MTAFTDRHIGPNSADRQHMLAALGFADLSSLIARAVPAAIRPDADGDLPPAMSEVEVLAELRRLAGMNRPARNFIGQGYYGTHLPTVIQRNVLENPAWYTAYTPYQPEISQGRLEALLNFQTVVTDLTGLDVAGASLLDEATAAAEAMTWMLRSSRSDSRRVLVDRDTHPQTIAVLETRARPLDIEVELFDPTAGEELPTAFGVILSYPGSSGRLLNHAALVEQAHAAGMLVAVATDLLSLLLLEPPGSWGADAAFGSAQRFGVPMAFGGPHAGFLSVRKGAERNLPGRLVGVSVDSHGNPAYRLALQTREQHIRREKATSNICTAQALLAVIASMYASYHGWSGLSEIASRTHRFARRFAAAVAAAGMGPVADAYFDTVAFRHDAAERVAGELAAGGINLRVIDAGTLAAAFDETTDEEGFAALLAALGLKDAGEVAVAIPSELARKAAALTHPVFEQYRSETEMMRYLRRLADFDLALDRTMIPLGSCTMKLNAATEMAAITWPEFAGAHPYAPAEQNRGWLQLISELEVYLAEVTGYDRVSLQPNAGSQGEFAGLLAVAAYHRSRGEGHRNICLIPSSAHGTNAASAVMAGMKVVVVGCDDAGNVDLADLKAKLAEHGAVLAAIMITYPSTHGVYEDTVSEICDLVHAAGGQVYVDGANLNALIGVARPGKFGADVSHLNLHKTFAIPHGGGGPGVGPIGVRAHLAPFLPGDPLNPAATPVGPVSAANFGSAGVLPIPYAYIRMMGMAGLREATETAVLSANYLAKRLGERYPVLYTNEHGLVAHECILDLREITKRSGVSVDDVAKRLIDFGFHAPTMSFPVAGTLMIEPTESESLFELDRFVTAMLAIADEIADIEEGRVAHADSALANAPHTAASLLDSDLSSAARMAAAFPKGVDRRSKYWPPVGRIDGAYGDRNLVCTCPDPSAFAED